MSLETKRLYEFGPYRIDAKKRLLQRDGEVVQLTPKPFDLLVLLVESGGEVLTKEYLIEQLWPDSYVEEGNLTVAVSTLRKALGESPGQHRYIVTVPGRGYKFVADVRPLWDETASLIVEERTASHIVVEHEEVEPRTEGAALRRVGLTAKVSTLGTRVRIALLIIPAVIVAALIWWGINRQPAQTDARSLSALNFIPLTNWKSEPGDNPNTSAATFSRSDNGRMIAFSSRRGGYCNLWVKQTLGGEPIQITKEKWNDFTPIWSRDSQHIAFISDRGNQVGIWKIPALGGSPVLLKSLETDGRRPTLKYWSDDESRIFYELNSNLFLLEVASGEVSQLTSFETSKSPPVHFSICPNEQKIAYTDYREGQYELWVKPLQAGEPVRVTSYASRDTLPIWHPDGERVFYSADHAGAYQIFVAYLDGRPPLQITVGGSDYLLSDVSPDGSKILTLSAREEADIWSLDIATGRPHEVVTDAAIELWPRVSPTGQAVAYQTTGSREKIPNSSIVVKPVAGSAQPVRLTDKGYNFSWSPDGSKLAFLRFDDKVNLWMVSGTGGNERQLTNEGVLIGGFIPLPCDRCQAEDFCWSPDGSRIIYSSRRSGVQNIWAVAIGSGNYQVTDNTDPNLMLSSPLYSPDGSRIVYLSETRKAPAHDRKTWTIWLGDGSRSQAVCTSQSIMRIVGWSATGDSLIVASLEGKETYPVTASTIDLFRLDLGSGERQAVGRLSSAYFSSLRLSHDKSIVAFVSEQNDMNGIWLAAVDGGEPRMVLELAEPRSYICSLIWSPDDKTIYYVKQSSTSSISLIDNFR